jgi:hypothetical protein
VPTVCNMRLDMKDTQGRLDAKKLGLHPTHSLGRMKTTVSSLGYVGGAWSQTRDLVSKIKTK